MDNDLYTETEEAYRAGMQTELRDARRVVVPFVLLFVAATLACGLIGFFLSRR